MGLNHIPIIVSKSWYVKDDKNTNDPRIDYQNLAAKIQFNINKLNLPTL